jgi:hypothetical protein
VHAVRVAARVRRELQVDVDVVGGPYGRFEVLLDGAPALEGGPLAALGILPSAHEVIDALRAKLANAETAPAVS